MRKTALPALCVVAALTALTVPSQATTAHTGTTADADTRYAYQGDAYGTKVNVGTTVTSGRSAPVIVSCTTTAGKHNTNTVANVNLSPLVTSGTVNTFADTYASPTETKTSATVEQVNLLSGAVTATAVRSVSSTSHTTAGFQLSDSGTTFTSLRVLGVPVAADVAPNTRVNLPGYGYVVLNEQTSYIRSTSAKLTVNAVHLVIDQTNALGIAVGTNLIVAHATSALQGPVTGILDGFAFGSSVKVGSVLRSGPSFQQILPCLGTNGQLRVNQGAGVTVSGVVTTGAIRNTARGTVNASTATGETTSTVDSTNLLSGLVQATVIKADAHSATDGTNFTFSDAGSSFGSLSVAGHSAIGANVAANTKVTISGLGTLWLHRVVRTPNSIEVRMIELVVTQANNSGLPIGSDIKIAVAHASAH